MSAPYTQSRSPPPLVHPRPSHISQPPPEPITPDPSSPYMPQNRLSVEQARASFDAARQSSDGFTRYSSPPVQGYAGATGTSNSFGMGGMPVPPQGMNDYTPAPAQSFGSFGAATGYGGFAGPSSTAGPNAGGMYNPGMHGSAPTQPGQGFQSMMGGLGQWPMVGMNEATASLIGKAGHDYVEKNVSRYLPLPLLKTSFSVTNSYVLKKLRLLLFPWRHKSWSRKVSRRGTGGAGEGPGVNGGQMMVEGWMAPREDINAPDLYIPSKSAVMLSAPPRETTVRTHYNYSRQRIFLPTTAMALVTYTLLAAFASGHPEVLASSLSKSFAVVVFEFLCIRYADVACFVERRIDD